MTIMVQIKVNDGVVIASDSATTYSVNTQIANVYSNVNKIFTS